MLFFFLFYRAVTDPRDGRRVALKKLPNVFQSLVSSKRVFRELKMLCFFKHENVSWRLVCIHEFSGSFRCISFAPIYNLIMLHSYMWSIPANLFQITLTLNNDSKQRFFSRLIYGEKKNKLTNYVNYENMKLQAKLHFLWANKLKWRSARCARFLNKQVEIFIYCKSISTTAGNYLLKMMSPEVHAILYNLITLFYSIRNYRQLLLNWL